MRTVCVHGEDEPQGSGICTESIVFFPPLFVFFSPDSHLIRAHRPKGFSQASDFIKWMIQLNLTRGTFGLTEPALCKLKRCNYCNVYKSNRKKTS